MNQYKVYFQSLYGKHSWMFLVTAEDEGQAREKALRLLPTWVGTVQYEIRRA